jgi:hypothetical protein
MAVYDLLDVVRRTPPAVPEVPVTPRWLAEWPRKATLPDAKAVLLVQRATGIDPHDRAAAEAVLLSAHSAGLLHKSLTTGNTVEWTRPETDPEPHEAGKDSGPDIHIGATRVAREVQIRTIDGEIVTVAAWTDVPGFSGPRAQYLAETGRA